MSPGQKIALDAMKKEHKSLVRRARAAKKKVDDNVNSYSTIINIRKEAQALISSGRPWASYQDKFERLAKKEKAAVDASKGDLVKLMDEANKLEFAANDLAGEISTFEYRYNRT